MVPLHAVEFIQPHLLCLDLTVERRKLLRHTEQSTNGVKAVFAHNKTKCLHSDVVPVPGITYRNTTNSASRMEISDRKPRSSLLFILFLGVDVSQQQTSSLHHLLT